MYIAGSGSPHVADAQVGEIRGYARLPPPAGVAEMSASTIRLRRRGGGADTSLRPVMPLWCTALLRSGASFGLGDGNWACLERRLGGKGIQGACAPMAELALREQRGCFR